LQQQLFGQKSEQSKASSEQIETSDVNSLKFHTQTGKNSA